MSLSVVAGVIRDAQGRILLAQRPPGKHLAGTWEFPGGKLESGEAPELGLARELEEELGLRVRASRPVLSLTHAYPEKTIRLQLREVIDWDGEPHGREGQPLGWFALDDMNELPMPAADRPMLKALALDPRLVISPDPRQFATIEGFLADWEARLAAGFRWLQLRAPEFDVDSLQGLAARCGELARAYGARWMVHGDAQLARAAGADGVHLDAAALAGCRRRPLSHAKLVCASCDHAPELDLAGRLKLDFVIVGSVLGTAPHQTPRGLGWTGLERLCARSPLPVLGQGGLSPADLDRARACGAFGVAGTAGFCA